MHILFLAHIATECVCVHIHDILHLFHIFVFIYFVFIYLFLLLKLVGTQVEVYADCVFSVLTVQVDSSDQDDN